LLLGYARIFAAVIYELANVHLNSCFLERRKRTRVVAYEEFVEDSCGIRR
jgi:hypothetical protein